LRNQRQNHATSAVRRRTRIVSLAALGIIVGVWFLGFHQSQEGLLPVFEQINPDGSRIVKVNERVFKGVRNDTTVCFFSTASASGYGGEITVAVAVSALPPRGRVLASTIVDHKESPSYIARVQRKGFLESLQNLSYRDPLVLGEDVDAVTGATYTSKAIIQSIGEATRSIASRQLSLELPPRPAKQVSFGFPEVVLIALFVVGFLGINRRSKYRLVLRWISMITALVVIGLVLNNPLTLTSINKLLMGYLPDWRDNLYWYLLTGGVILILLVDRKNHYCDWVCPFGAAQECLGLVGGAKVRSMGPFSEPLRWLPRLLALTAILIALFFRNPGMSSYEAFAVFFDFFRLNVEAFRDLSRYRFFLLAIVLVAALFIKRPWCRFLCPIPPVMDFIREFRTWLFESWPKKKA